MEMWTEGYKQACSWRKMEAAAQKTAEDEEEWSVAVCSKDGHGSVGHGSWVNVTHPNFWMGHMGQWVTCQ